MAMKMILVRSLHIFMKYPKRPKKMNKCLESWHPNLSAKKPIEPSSIQNNMVANWWSDNNNNKRIPAWNCFFPCGVEAPLQNTWQVWILKHFQYAHLLFKLTSRHLYAPIKRNCKKSSCFITVQSRFWLMNIYPWKWNLLSSKIVHSPIKCDWMFFSSTVAAVNNGKALHLIRGGFIHASVCRP